jgi:hypothetical protein
MIQSLVLNRLRRNYQRVVVAIVLISILFWIIASRSPPKNAPISDPVSDSRFAAALSRVHTSSGGYTPSRLEAQWASHAREWDGELCMRIASELENWQRWFDVARTGIKENDKRLNEVFSTLAVTEHGVIGSAPLLIHLEPLAGYLRDPRPSCPGLGLMPALADDREDSKGHIFLDPILYGLVSAGLRSGPEAPRALLFDLGSTRWEPASVGLSGAAWLLDAYAKLGITFDAVFAWEATPVSSREYFGSMPLELASRWHFYNFPVIGPRHEGPAASAPGAPGPDDPLKLLRTVARPGDFVVFKIDIDAQQLEEDIIVELILDEGLGALVDDLYFEHHVRNPVMGPRGWGGGQVRDVKDSIGLFQALRRAGIRAHSWP